jgi:acetylornithine/succinyldiaminopimelate/putrescine aminotransferase
MSPKTFTQPYHPLLPGIRHIRFGAQEDLRHISERTACVVLETVQAESGVRKPSVAYLQALREQCSRTGTLLVFDEIQVGFGRTGALWAFSAYGVVPDILLLAKGMGGGMPIGAFVASDEHMQCLGMDPPLGHITTFGGHPVSCAAAHATLGVLLQESLVAEVPEKEACFLQHLVHPDIREVRSAGLLLAIELEGFDRMRRVMLRCLELGLLTDWFLFNDRSLRVAPPLTIDMASIRRACEILLEAIDQTR